MALKSFSALTRVGVFPLFLRDRVLIFKYILVRLDECTVEEPGRRQIRKNLSLATLSHQCLLSLELLHRPGEKMDPTLIQQQPAQDVMNGNGDANVEAVAAAPVEQEQPKTYDDLFPSLPASAPLAPAGSGSAAPIGEWNRKPIFQSTVTQVWLKFFAQL